MISKILSLIVLAQIVLRTFAHHNRRVQFDRRVQFALSKQLGWVFRGFHHAQIIENMAERVGFNQARLDRFFAFQQMPITIVTTGVYVVSQIEHASHKKH
jgi:hypothetical protein